MVTVYRFQHYDIVSKMAVRSRRWATPEAIERVLADVIEGTGIKVDPSILDRNGMTARDFNRRARGWLAPPSGWWWCFPS